MTVVSQVFLGIAFLLAMPSVVFIVFAAGMAWLFYAVKVIDWLTKVADRFVDEKAHGSIT